MTLADVGSTGFAQSDAKRKEIERVRGRRRKREALKALDSLQFLCCIMTNEQHHIEKMVFPTASKQMDCAWEVMTINPVQKNSINIFTKYTDVYSILA